MNQPVLARLDHLTFKGNLKTARYGWLRLTPAYSVHLVAELLDKHATPGGVVLDPFCGTGTTALVCSERGIPCDTTDINPFLLWLAKAKTNIYTANELQGFRTAAARVAEVIRVGASNNEAGWTPPLHQIEKWWSAPVLATLGRAMTTLRKLEKSEPEPVMDLLKVAFCRMMIEQANVSFGHQSMSFKKAQVSPQLMRVSTEGDVVAGSWERAVAEILLGATTGTETKPRLILCDARNLRERLSASHYGCVITSPPYPNRMSYIRELRPYMYWLGYLIDGRAAGELDWQAIGGTWGCATSNVAKWQPAGDPRPIPFPGFEDILSRIAERSAVLSRYVHKYFHDMAYHCASLVEVLQPGATVHYIVGNSKFYEVMLPVEEIYASMFEASGLVDVGIKAIRKRTSKKELFEFVVSARKPLKRT